MRFHPVRSTDLANCNLSSVIGGLIFSTCHLIIGVNTAVQSWWYFVAPRVHYTSNWTSTLQLSIPCNKNPSWRMRFWSTVFASGKILNFKLSFCFNAQGLFLNHSQWWLFLNHLKTSKKRSWREVIWHLRERRSICDICMCDIWSQTIVQFWMHQSQSV